MTSRDCGECGGDGYTDQSHMCLGCAGSGRKADTAKDDSRKQPPPFDRDRCLEYIGDLTTRMNALARRVDMLERRSGMPD